MNQRGQIEILILLIVAGLILFSQWRKGEKLPWQMEIKKEAPISKPFYQTPQSPSEKNLPPPPSPEEKAEPPAIEKDTTPPKIFNPEPSGELPSETRQTILSLETDEEAICRWSLISGMSYDSMQNIFQNTASTSHSTEIRFLGEGEDYKFYVKCQDESGNKNLDDFEISFSVKKPEDKTPPERRNLSPSGMLSASTTEIELMVSTDEEATCYYSTVAGKDFWDWGNYQSFQANETGTYHTAGITATTTQVYDYFVRCCDTNKNCNDDNALIRFGIGVLP